MTKLSIFRFQFLHSIEKVYATGGCDKYLFMSITETDENFLVLIFVAKYASVLFKSLFATLLSDNCDVETTRCKNVCK